MIGGEIGGLAGALGTAELERLRQWIVAQPEQNLPVVRVTGPDVRGAVAVFLLVFLSTFPVVLPFVVIADPGMAKRVSAAVAIVMLFLCGHAWGRYAGLNPWRTGLVMVVLGLIVEAIVIALGG
jgi:VIT1/CCC1 family predicted Fe2+/Mn2+ transporter